MDDLIAAIVDVRDKLRRGVFSNEDQVSKGVVMRLLQQLGWDVYDPTRVSSEFKIGNRKVDYALRHEPFGPVILIEVKDVGRATAKGEDQLFDYCSKQGVPLAILTDGGTWSFYLPAGMGSYEQRRFAVVDLVSDEGSRCATVLRRYLGFDVVVSGQSHRDAQSDYQIYRQQIVAREQFAPVLQSLLAGADPRVVSLFADEVERRCQIRPDEGEVSSFLRTQFRPITAPKPAPKPHGGPRSSSQPSVSDRSAKPVPPPNVESNAPSFTLSGQTVSCRNDKELLVRVLNPTSPKRDGQRP